MTTPIKQAFNRVKVKPVAGLAKPIVKPVGAKPAAPAPIKRVAPPAGLLEQQKADLVKLAAHAQAVKAAEAKAAADKAKVPAETAQVAAVATTPVSALSSSEIPALTTTEVPQMTAEQISAFLKTHPDVEEQIEKLAEEGK